MHVQQQQLWQQPPGLLRQDAIFSAIQIALLPTRETTYIYI